MKKWRKVECSAREIMRACDLLRHFHREHTGNKITALTPESNDVDIFIASDDDCRRQMRALCEYETRPEEQKRTQ